MVFKLEGCCSFTYAHIWSKSGMSICWMHFVTSKESSNLISSRNRHIWLHMCATCSELPCYISTMGKLNFSFACIFFQLIMIFFFVIINLNFYLMNLYIILINAFIQPSCLSNFSSCISIWIFICTFIHSSFNTYILCTIH